jgi:hypothetical protein
MRSLRHLNAAGAFGPQALVHFMEFFKRLACPVHAGSAANPDAYVLPVPGHDSGGNIELGYADSLAWAAAARKRMRRQEFQRSGKGHAPQDGLSVLKNAFRL